jgi:hypothetical protein
MPTIAQCSKHCSRYNVKLLIVLCCKDALCAENVVMNFHGCIN